MVVKADRERQWKKKDSQEGIKITVSFCVNYTQYNLFKDFGRKGKFLPEFLLKIHVLFVNKTTEWGQIN